MTAISGPGDPVLTPWQRYLAETHDAQETYLRITAKAHAMYLTGPWPDRDSYQTVERQAWNTYYMGGRDSWRRYMAAVQLPATPPPPPADTGRSDPVGEEWDRPPLGRPYLPSFRPSEGNQL